MALFLRRVLIGVAILVGAGVLSRGLVSHLPQMPKGPEASRSKPDMRQPRFIYRPNVWLILTAMGGVQRELALSDEQKAALEDVDMQFRQEVRDATAAARGLQGEERSTKLLAAQPSLAAGKQAVREVLTADQYRRLAQIAAQVHLGPVLADPEFHGELGISEEQGRELVRVHEEGVKQIRELQKQLSEGQGDPRQMFQAGAKIEKDMLATLTDEQKEKLTKFKGEPFQPGPGDQPPGMMGPGQGRGQGGPMSGGGPPGMMGRGQGGGQGGPMSGGGPPGMMGPGQGGGQGGPMSGGGPPGMMGPGQGGGQGGPMSGGGPPGMVGPGQGPNQGGPMSNGPGAKPPRNVDR